MTFRRKPVHSWLTMPQRIPVVEVVVAWLVVDRLELGRPWVIAVGVLCVVWVVAAVLRSLLQLQVDIFAAGRPGPPFDKGERMEEMEGPTPHTREVRP